MDIKISDNYIMDKALNELKGHEIDKVNIFENTFLLNDDISSKTEVLKLLRQ